MYFRNNVSKNSAFVLLALIMCSNLSAMNGLERVVHIDRATAYAGDSIQTQNVATPSVIMYNYSPDDFTNGDRNATFFKKVKNALHRGFFYGISNIGATLVTFAINGVGYLALNRALSQKTTEASVTLEQLYLEAQLIKAYEQQNHHLSVNGNDQQNQEFQERLKLMKKSYSDHIIEYFKQNQKQKDAESENKITSLPTGIPTPAA